MSPEDPQPVMLYLPRFTRELIALGAGLLAGLIAASWQPELTQAGAVDTTLLLEFLCLMSGFVAARLVRWNVIGRERAIPIAFHVGLRVGIFAAVLVASAFAFLATIHAFQAPTRAEEIRLNMLAWRTLLVGLLSIIPGAAAGALGAGLAVAADFSSIPKLWSTQEPANEADPRPLGERLQARLSRWLSVMALVGIVSPSLLLLKPQVVDRSSASSQELSSSASRVDQQPEQPVTTSTKSRSERTNQLPAAPPLSASERAMAERIRKFIVSHHAKVSAKDVAGLMSDYAETVDYQGITRKWTDMRVGEEEFFRTWTTVKETVVPGIDVLEKGDAVYVVAYAIDWEKNNGDDWVSGTSDITRWVRASQSGFLIIRHACDDVRDIKTGKVTKVSSQEKPRDTSLPSQLPHVAVSLDGTCWMRSSRHESSPGSR